MKRLINLVIIPGIIFLCITCVTQQVEKSSDRNSSNSNVGEKWLWQRQYIYPVANSDLYDPRDPDYKLVQNWEFDNQREFLADWERLDGVRENQPMYHRNNDANYGFEKLGNNSYLQLKTLYHNPGLVYSTTWPRPYSSSYQFSTAECMTKKSFMYGYFEARIKLPGFIGAHPSFWLFSKGYDGNALEIDIMEATSGGLMEERQHKFTSNFSEYNHTRGDKHFEGFFYQDKIENSLSEEFHIYAVEWTPFDLRFYLDNQLIRVDKIPSEYKEFPCYVRLGVAVDHWNPPTKKVFDPMVVDYVKVYQKDILEEGYQRPQIEYKDRIIKDEEWVVASIKNPSPSKNYYWETDGNASFNVDQNNDLHFKLNRGKSRNTIIGLESRDKNGTSETNAWKDQVVFTNMLPLSFELLLYKTECNQDGKGKVTVKTQDLSKYGVRSTTFKVYLKNINGDVKGSPIETLVVPSPGNGVFWLEPETEYWIEHTAEWPGGGPVTTAKTLFYPVMHPTFNPRIYKKNVGGSERIFVDGACDNGNQINRWFLYGTDLNNTKEDYLESQRSPGSKTFCFDLSKYPKYTYFVVVHEVEQANGGKCFSTQTRKMYFTSQRYNATPPSNPYCPRK